MFKRFLSRTKSWALAGLLVLSLWVMVAQPAKAGKVAKALTFDETGHSIEVLAVYETSYAAQKSLMKSLKLPIKQMKKAAGFQGGSMLQSQDGKQVIALSQWQDLASYQAYQPSPPANDSASPAATPAAPTQTLVFEMVTAQPFIPGITPALRGKEAVVQLVQLTPKEAEMQLQLLAQVKAILPQLLEQQPIPQSSLLFKGVDHDAIAFMMNWNCSAMFEDVGQPGAIALPADLTDLADSTQQLYTVATIIPAEVEKPEEED